MATEIKKKIWFRRKRYGWGWFPITWQGWVVVGAYVVFVIILAIHMPAIATPQQVLWRFVVPLIIAVLTLIFLCYKFGEKPSWQWGNDSSDRT